MSFLERVCGERVMPDEHRVFALSPTSPPERGHIVLVDSDRRMRVTRSKVKWNGPYWRILDLRAKPCPGSSGSPKP